MYHARLTCIIRRLNVRIIHNMSAHARRRHKTSSTEILKLLTDQRRAFFGLTTPVLSCCSSAVVNAVKISRHDGPVVRDAAIKDGSLIP